MPRIKAIKQDKPRETKQPPPVERMAYSIREFCDAHGIHIDTYFRMQRAGTGPVTMKLRNGTRISVEAAAEWRRAREQAAKNRREAATETT